MLPQEPGASSVESMEGICRPSHQPLSRLRRLLLAGRRQLGHDDPLRLHLTDYDDAEFNRKPTNRRPWYPSMITNRLELALDRLQPADWAKLEKIASVFLASEFDGLRTVASPSGDDGRDAELFSPEAEPKVVAQYSVAADWRAKINSTVRRLKTTIPDALVLIYVTSKQIGADADDLKKTLRTKYGLTLDVRDRSWFCDRVLESRARQISAEELATAIVDPYLSLAGVGPHVQSELSSPEAMAAVTYLGLQWRDDVRDKGLTKLAFEALVRAALVGTDSDHRIARVELHQRVGKVLLGHPPEQLTAHVDSAIRRLGKASIKQWPGDEFCLSHEEVQRFNNFRVANALAESSLIASVDAISTLLLTARAIPLNHKAEFALRLRSATDAVLFERSQAFAMAVQSGSLAALADTDFKSTLISELAKSSLPKLPKVDWLSALQVALRELLISDDSAIQAYLRSLADSYTLLAFLKQTPDVQSAVEKMFSHGTLWLDATVVLPLIADTLTSSDDGKGRFTRMIEAALDVGLKLYVTPGMVEEVERHMNKALTCVRMTSGQWHGSIPYLLERYVASGRSPSAFPSWLENFRGDARPLQDLADYLQDVFHIGERSLEAESASASQELRFALQQIWHERYARRKEKYGTPLDEMAVTRLVSHDVECYAGAVHLRSQERSSPFGYSAWWLTVDRQAFDLKNRLRSIMSEAPPDSPVMSADFLVNYLAFGPLRRRVTKDAESHLPLLMVLGNAAQLTPELMAEAQAIRLQLKDLPERLVRREVRDRLDRARARIGPIAGLGMDEVDEAVQR